MLRQIIKTKYQAVSRRLGGMANGTGWNARPVYIPELVRQRNGYASVKLTQELRQDSGMFWFAPRNNDNGEDDEKKKTGFEKFLRKTRKGQEKKEESKDGDKKDQKASKDDDMSDPEAEEETEAKQEEERKKSTKEDGAREKVNQFFFQPGGGGPRWENVSLVAFLIGALGYSMASDVGKPSSEEVTYADFINEYLVKNQCKAITISEAKESDMYQFVAHVALHDGRTIHLVLPQIELFNMKME